MGSWSAKPKIFVQVCLAIILILIPPFCEALGGRASQLPVELIKMLTYNGFLKCKCKSPGARYRTNVSTSMSNTASMSGDTRASVPDAAPGHTVPALHLPPRRPRRQGRHQVLLERGLVFNNFDIDVKRFCTIFDLFLV